MISILAQHMDLVGVARFNELAFIVAQAVESPQTTAGLRGNDLPPCRSSIIEEGHHGKGGVVRT
jgi:hypothetical protein